MRGFSASGGRRACIIGTSVSAMNCALPMPSSSTGPGEFLADRRDARGRRRAPPICLRARDRDPPPAADRRRVRSTVAERLPHRHAVARLRFGVHRERRDLNRRDRFEALAVQVVARAVDLRDRHFGEIDVGMRARTPPTTAARARRHVAGAVRLETGTSSGRIVSTGGSSEKSGIGSLAVRFWNAAFLRANIVTARLYAASVVSQISRRIAS